MNERYERGRARQAELGGAGGVRRRAYDLLAEVAPDLPRLAVEFAYGDIHARPGLDPGRRELVVIGALIALGDTAPQLEAHLGSALSAGTTPGELVEAVMQAVPYAGFPRVLAAMSVARQVFDQRGLLPVQPPNQEKSQTVNPQDRADITDLCTRMMWSVDTRDWAAFTPLFAPEVTLDFTSFWGGEPDRTTPEGITATWSELFSNFEATQHLLGNHLVTADGDRGELTAAFHSTHVRRAPYGDPLWTFGGEYRFGVVRIDGAWKIEQVVMTAGWGRGNSDVVKGLRA